MTKLFLPVILIYSSIFCLPRTAYCFEYRFDLNQPKDTSQESKRLKVINQTLDFYEQQYNDRKREDALDAYKERSRSRDTKPARDAFREYYQDGEIPDRSSFIDRYDSDKRSGELKDIYSRSLMGKSQMTNSLFLGKDRDPSFGKDQYVSDQFSDEAPDRADVSAEDEMLSQILSAFDYGFVVEDNTRPRFYLETVFPLFGFPDENKVIFSHNRLDFRGANLTASGGVGYRRVIADHWMGGINSFYDFQDKHNHHRMGFGLELFSDSLETRFNYYEGLSPVRKVLVNTQRTVYEKVIDGFDGEVGGRLPYLPWVKFFGGYRYFEYIHSTDSKGWKARLELKPTKYITLNLETFDDEMINRGYRLDGRFKLAFDSFDPKDIVAAIKDTDTPKKNPERDVKEHLLDRVEREFDITIERWEGDGETTTTTPLPVGSGGDIQIQLIWATDSDMDMHMNLPAGSPTHIYYAAKQSYIGSDLFAELDVDDIPLSGGHASHPGRDHVENIFVEEGMIVAGTYSPYVVAYNLVTTTAVTVNVFVQGSFVRTETHTFTVDDERYDLTSIVYP